MALLFLLTEDIFQTKLTIDAEADSRWGGHRKQAPSNDDYSHYRLAYGSAGDTLPGNKNFSLKAQQPLRVSDGRS